jgi:hypothetical protein
VIAVQHDDTIIRALLANVMDSLHPAITDLRAKGYRVEPVTTAENGTVTLTIVVHTRPPRPAPPVPPADDPPA